MYRELIHIIAKVKFTNLKENLCRDKILPWIKENLGVIILEVEDERSGKKGVIGFGVSQEEVYREIPISDGWEIRYLGSLFDSPSFILYLRDLRGDDITF